MSEKVKENPTAEMPQINYKNDHTPFNCLQSMATNGVLPNRLEYCPHAVCAACLYGKATKVPHKAKIAISINEYKPVVSVGDSVYIYVLVSIPPFFITQMSVLLRRKRYQCACIFVNHHYDFTCVHLLKSQNGYESVE